MTSREDREFRLEKARELERQAKNLPRDITLRSAYLKSAQEIRRKYDPEERP